MNWYIRRWIMCCGKTQCLEHVWIWDISYDTDSVATLTTGSWACCECYFLQLMQLLMTGRWWSRWCWRRGPGVTRCSCGRRQTRSRASDSTLCSDYAKPPSTLCSCRSCVRCDFLLYILEQHQTFFLIYFCNGTSIFPCKEIITLKATNIYSTSSENNRPGL